MKTLAVIAHGGRQFLVEEGSVIKTDIKKDTIKIGDTVAFDDVLFVDDGTSTKVGTPNVPGVKVIGVVERVGRGKKIEGLKYKAKSDFTRRYGHRQNFVQVKITSIK